MRKENRTLFDWLTVAAAWLGVVVASTVAYRDFRQSQMRPEVAYGQFGACYKVKGEEADLVYWRMSLSNRGPVAAKDVFVKIVDVPEDAEIWSSVAFKVEERTKDTALLRYEVIPPRYRAFTSILPFRKRSQSLMPYARERYFADGRITLDRLEVEATAIDVYQKLARTEGYISGVKGNHRDYRDLVTSDDIATGNAFYTIEDR